MEGERDHKLERNRSIQKEEAFTYTLQQRDVLKEQRGVQLEGMELTHDIGQTRKPHKFPILVPIPSLCQLVQLLLLRRSRSLFGQQLEHLWSGRIGDVQIVGECFSEGHWDWHPLLLHPSDMASRLSPRLDIDEFVGIRGEIETVDELVDDL